MKTSLYSSFAPFTPKQTSFMLQLTLIGLFNCIIVGVKSGRLSKTIRNEAGGNFPSRLRLRGFAAFGLGDISRAPMTLSTGRHKPRPHFVSFKRSYVKLQPTDYSLATLKKTK